MTSLTLHMGGVTVPPDTLQNLVNAAGAGSTLALGSWEFSAGATVNKALTITGGTINFPAGHTALTVTHSDVVIDGVTITGSQYAHYDGSDYAIDVQGTSGSPITGFVVRNCHVTSSGKAGIWMSHVTGAVVHNNVVEDCCYTGITGFSMVGGEITDNTIRRIGYTCPEAELPGSGNSYGINVNDQGTPCSSDVEVSGNTIEDVPTWHGLDTHGGLRISFISNIIRRSRRGLFITGSVASGAHATDIVVTSNQLLAPELAEPITAVTLAGVYGATFTGNTITGWGNNSPTNEEPWYDYLGESTGLVNGGGNVVTK
jgi:hypothetical protein